MQLRHPFFFFFSEMQCFPLSSPKKTKAMKESDKHASYTSGESFFVVFLNCRASELCAKGRQAHTSGRKSAQNLKCACRFHKTWTTVIH